MNELSTLTGRTRLAPGTLRLQFEYCVRTYTAEGKLGNRIRYEYRDA